MTEAQADSSITLFIVPHCPLCDDARAWLEEHGIAFIERDVQNDFGALRAMYRLTKQNLVPVYVRGGRALVRPSAKQLAELFLLSER